MEDEPLRVVGPKELKAYEVLVAPFTRNSVETKKFLSFEICKVEPRESQTKKNSISNYEGSLAASCESEKSHDDQALGKKLLCENFDKSN